MPAAFRGFGGALSLATKDDEADVEDDVEVVDVELDEAACVSLEEAFGLASEDWTLLRTIWRGNRGLHNIPEHDAQLSLIPGARIHKFGHHVVVVRSNAECREICILELPASIKVLVVRDSVRVICTTFLVGSCTCS